MKAPTVRSTPFYYAALRLGQLTTTSRGVALAGLQSHLWCLLWNLMNRVDDKNYRERVYEIVRRIPSGKVMTYGLIAEILGEGYTPRTVGYVMHGAGENVPWQRVINSQGACSTGRMTMPVNLQQNMLESEGVVFNESGKCDLGQYLWYPEGYEPEKDEQPSLLN